MDDLRERLIKCFAAVFPDLKPEQIPQASQSWVPEWDSIATVTLLSVLEEEFGVSFDLEELEHLTDFESILDKLKQHAGA